MNSKSFAAVLCAVVLLISGLVHAAEPQAVIDIPELSADAKKITITEGDILDRPYRVLGQVFVRAKKIGLFDRPPIEEKTNILLKIEAAELGADAVINVRRERGGVTVFNFGYMDGIGTAVVFDNNAVRSPQRPAVAAPPPVNPVSPVSPTPPTTAAPSSPSPATQIPPRTPLIANPSERLVAFLNAINGGNAGTALGLFAPDGVIEDPAGSQPLVGRAAIESYLRALIGRGVKYELVMHMGSAATRTAAMAVRASVEGTSANVIQTFAFRPDGAISKLSVHRSAVR